MPTDRDLLDLERQHPGHDPRKYDAIYALGLTEARYYQRLHRAARSLEGQAYDPVTAHRVLRMLGRVA